MRQHQRYFKSILIGVVLLFQLPAFSVVKAQTPDPATKTPIKHFIVLMQENHTYDNYFGTYPGGNGIPAGVKMPIDPNNPDSDTLAPFHLGNYPIEDPNHSAETFALQFNNGKMNGFIAALNARNQDGKIAMGYYDDRDLPFHWNVADNFVLFDNLFSSASNGSFDNHMYWVAGTSPETSTQKRANGSYDDLVTIFDRLEEKGISWKFYVQNYDPEITYLTTEGAGNRASQVIWVPLLNFNRFLNNPQLNGHIVDLNQYYIDLQNGTLPAVAYIAPSGASEHPPGSLASGQRFVRTLTQELMRSRYWKDTAFMYVYDDWGGWYDHVAPPQVDQYGYGFRVPGLLVSAYAKKGYIDHTQMDFTSILKFIQYNWGVNSLSTRDAAANNILDAFEFNQKPRSPVFISSTRETPPEIKPSQSRPIYLAYGIIITAAVAIIFFAMVLSLRYRRKKVIGAPLR